MFTTSFSSPLGVIQISGTETYITSVLFVEEVAKGDAHLPEVLVKCRQELEEYFEGTRQHFTVAVQPEGTDFQKQVWEQLKLIRYAETISYRNIARLMNKDDRLSRAVGNANGKNPVAIIIPCHRVIGESGKLTGYAGGIWRKAWLLEHEKKVSGKHLSLF